MSYFPAVASSPVQPVTFGQGLTLSLDNYYDLLKASVGGLAVDEFLQLKLVADPVAISSVSYKWFSYYQLLRRSDRAIAPTPVDGVVMTSGSSLADEYERFLLQLRQYVIKVNLTPQQQKDAADIQGNIERSKALLSQYRMADIQNWIAFAEIMGYEKGDTTAYLQWAATAGHQREIDSEIKKLNGYYFDLKTIFDKQWPEPADREIVEAEAAFTDPAMRIRYPIWPDREYSNGPQFNLSYLAGLPLGSNAMFDDRRVITWNTALDYIESTGAGALSATFDRSTSESKSISTDWSGSASGSYGLFSAKASASEHKTIQEDFSKGTTIELSSKSAFKAEIMYPKWFRPTLFENKRVIENIHDFEKFFGEKGTLKYFPTHLILVRGFKIIFNSIQNWTYDYKKNFSASGGGGFGGFGFSFGGKASYSEDVHEHKVDVSNTKLTIADDETTVRFVGYTLKKVRVFEDAAKAATLAALGRSAADYLGDGE